MVKIVIAGGREFDDEGFLFGKMDAIKYLYGNDDIEVVSGGARGADRLGEKWAEFHGCSVKQFLPEYATYKNGAPLVRNTEMARYADVLVAFWDGDSHGTAHMIQEAMNNGMEVHVYRYVDTHHPQDDLLQG